MGQSVPGHQILTLRENFCSAERDVIALETEFCPSLGKHVSYLLTCVCYDATGTRKSLRVSGSDVPSKRSCQKQNQRTLLGLCRFPVKSFLLQVISGGSGLPWWEAGCEWLVFAEGTPPLSVCSLFTYLLLLICF